MVGLKISFFFRIKGIEDDLYSIPEDPSLSRCQDWAKSLPESAPPSALGLNENAAMAANERHSAALLAHTLATQPQLRFRATTGDSASADKELTAQAMLRRVRRDLISALPDDLDASAIRAGALSFDAGDSAVAESEETSLLNGVLRLEVDR